MNRGRFAIGGIASLDDPLEYARRIDEGGRVIYTRRPFWDVMLDKAARGKGYAIHALQARAAYAAKLARMADPT